MHPVVRAAFKAVELLIKWLEGSTPSSSATPTFTNLHQGSLNRFKYMNYGYFLFIMENRPSPKRLYNNSQSGYKSGYKFKGAALNGRRKIIIRVKMQAR